MNRETLTYLTMPIVEIGSNTFINVPVILKFEEINLIEIIKDKELGYTSSIPIYHPDGTYLAKIKGTRVFPTEAGKKANIKLDKLSDRTVCKLDNKILFEIKHQNGDSFKTSAELYTPEGYFVKIDEQAKPLLLTNNGNEVQIGGLIMSGSTFDGCDIGIWLKRNGGFSVGVNN